MNKPAGYDDLSIDIERPAPGGHRCTIVKVIEQKSRNGKEQLEIWLDMAGDDAQALLFSNQYMGSTSETKKWPCRVWITGYDTDDNGKRNLKRFVTAAEESNAGFFVSWDAMFADCLKGKRIGVVFGEEENEWNGKINTLVKPKYFRKVMDVEEAEIPEKKLLSRAADPNGLFGGASDEGIPFR